MVVIHWKPFQFTTHGNLFGGKRALREADKNIRQFKNSQTGPLDNLQKNPGKPSIVLSTSLFEGIIRSETYN